MKTFSGPFARFSSKEFLTVYNLTNEVINSPGFFETTYTTVTFKLEPKSFFAF